MGSALSCIKLWGSSVLDYGRLPPPEIYSDLQEITNRLLRRESREGDAYYLFGQKKALSSAWMQGPRILPNPACSEEIWKFPHPKLLVIVVISTKMCYIFIKM
jgi:hypothetical protein